MTQLCSPNSIVTTGDLNPSLDIWLIFARRFAPMALATALQSRTPSKIEANSQKLVLNTKDNFEFDMAIPNLFHCWRVKQLSPSRMRSPCLWKLWGRSLLSSSVHLSPLFSTRAWKMFSSLEKSVCPPFFFECWGNWNKKGGPSTNRKGGAKRFQCADSVLK